VIASAPLVVRDLSRRFGPKWVLVRVGFELPAGGGLLLLGANGSGKTTLLRVLATALRPHHGEARWGGRPLWDDREALRPAIALWSHATHLYDDLSARENLLVWARLGGYPSDAATLGARLARVGLADTGDRPVRAFSAGMKRRLALARTLLKRPRLALLDEPFTNLDAEGTALVGAVIDELKADGASVILSTHTPDLGRRHCERALRLEDGRVAWAGPASEAVARAGEAP
jgi:heme exporter protein A